MADEQPASQNTPESSQQILPPDNNLRQELPSIEDTPSGSIFGEALASATITQKVILIGIIVIILGGALVASQRTTQGILTTQTPQLLSPTLTATPKQSLVYYNEQFKVIIPIPKDWSGEFGAQGQNFLALKPNSQQDSCFPDAGQCPIMVEFKDNPRKLNPTEFGQPFFPSVQEIFGGQESATIVGLPGLVLYNIHDTGGRIVYIMGPNVVVRFTLQDKRLVSPEVVSLFERMLSGVEFSK